MDKTYEFTEAQDQSIGQLVTEHWGANIQTSFYNGLPLLYIGLSHTHILEFAIALDGTVARII